MQRKSALFFALAALYVTGAAAQFRYGGECTFWRGQAESTGACSVEAVSTSPDTLQLRILRGRDVAQVTADRRTGLCTVNGNRCRIEFDAATNTMRAIVNESHGYEFPGAP